MYIHESESLIFNFKKNILHAKFLYFSFVGYFFSPFEILF